MWVKAIGVYLLVFGDDCRQCNNPPPIVRPHLLCKCFETCWEIASKSFSGVTFQICIARMKSDTGLYRAVIDYTQKWIIVKIYFKDKEKTLKDACRHSPSGVINSILAKHEVYVNEKRCRILKIMTFRCRFQTRYIAQYILVKQAIIDLSMIYKLQIIFLWLLSQSSKDF